MADHPSSCQNEVTSQNMLFGEKIKSPDADLLFFIVIICCIIIKHSSGWISVILSCISPRAHFVMTR